VNWIAQMRELAAALPQGRLVIAAHNPQFEDAAPFNAVLLRFLATIWR
jgi:pimeloyl-ACP methyl ester carboxylesterase